VCGQWTRSCQPVGGGYRASSIAQLDVYSFRPGFFPAVDYAGTLGPMVRTHTVYADSDLSCTKPLLSITHVGQWQDLGAYAASVRVAHRPCCGLILFYALFLIYCLLLIREGAVVGITRLRAIAVHHTFVFTSLTHLARRPRGRS
jgi:hypothetical protein